MTTEDRMLGMPEAAKLLGVGTKRLRRTLIRAHAQHGNVLVKINRLYYVTESALRTLLPLVFSNTRSTVDDRISALETEVERTHKTLLETRQDLYRAKLRIKTLEARLKPGKALDD